MQIKVKITGADIMARKFKNVPKVLDKEIEIALTRSLASIEKNVKRRTPVDFGRLRASIGSLAEGWRWMRGKEASIGTKVEYAIYVEKIPKNYTVGEVGYFEKGVRASAKEIELWFRMAMQNLAKKITE